MRFIRRERFDLGIEVGLAQSVQGDASQREQMDRVRIIGTYML